jgi:hypothetical protein
MGLCAEMSGIKIKLGKGTTITRDGKIKVVPIYRDASHAIASRKSKKIRVVKR